MERYHVDQEQAVRVERKALHAFDQVAKDWELEDGIWRELLGWAAKVHEVGLDIAHYQYHKHGAYLIEHSDLAGFSREDQQMLALLVRGHRRNIPKDKFAEFGDEGIKLIRLCVLLTSVAPRKCRRSPCGPTAITWMWCFPRAGWRRTS